ncbi:ABC transporter ATP-binding protein [Sphingobium chlorophenolicum]|uniref:ABC-type polysaccharide/polyol phosphate transport system, ATPase component n=1 Tax=Sphingobium chlorophenolicum TaxID=46429 RepID=A0A081RGP8_SPHCR|nr:ATP-binding cassette domain-containing protein [Sphingobium chlorophenolicum]KEQ54371.1 ABC-type polysaccharide/polyol phosphate transport system, ATPase component [Sphingobium chlorophenolicum]
MMEMVDVWKRYPIHGGHHQVLKGVNLSVSIGEKLGILGRNGAGKSTMIRLISGAERPDQGQVTRKMSVSWPLAFGGAFQGTLTGLDNLRFICRVYGVDPKDKVDFVDDFAELGPFLREPVRTYSSGMRARLAFALSMVIEFDCFLIDEVVSVGDSRFTAKCELELFQKRKDRAMIIVSHDVNYLKKHCQKIVLLQDGQIRTGENIDEVLRIYSKS